MKVSLYERKKINENYSFHHHLPCDIAHPDNHKRKRPTCDEVATLKTGRRDVPGSNLGRACRLSLSDFSVVSSEVRVNTG